MKIEYEKTLLNEVYNFYSLDIYLDGELLGRTTTNNFLSDTSVIWQILQIKDKVPLNIGNFGCGRDYRDVETEIKEYMKNHGITVERMKKGA